MNGTMQLRATIVALAPATFLAALLYHPYIGDLTDKAAVAGALIADQTRWGLSHLAVGVASGLIVLAFLAIRSYLRAAGEERWSALGVPFIVMGGTLFGLLPAMEIGSLAATQAGAGAHAVQIALDTWFTPVLVTGAVVFWVGVLGFAIGVVRSRVLSPSWTWLAAGALIVMATSRFAPFGAALYIGGVAGIVAIWRLAYEMWRRPGFGSPPINEFAVTRSTRSTRTVSESHHAGDGGS